MTLDRSLRPDFQLPESAPLINLTSLNTQGTHWQNSLIDAEVSRIEMSFPKSADKLTKGSLYLLSKILLEGTKLKDKESFHSQLDACGAFLDVTSSKDYLSLTLHTLNRKLDTAMDLVAELLTQPNFSSTIFSKILEIEKQHFSISMEKSSTIAQIQFEKGLFGEESQYTPITDISELDNVNIQDLELGWDSVIKDKSPYLFITSSDPSSSISSRFGGEDQKPLLRSVRSSESFETLIDKEDALQSAIRLGGHSIEQQSSEYFSLSFANTLFGGYFGSRLMQNIREDKGYTYGIYSSLRHLNNASYWMIGADVKKANRADAIVEIKKELSKMSTDLVSTKEIHTVQNYLKGDLLSSLASPFDITSRWKTIILKGLPVSYYADYYASLNTNTPDSIREIAKKHMNPDQLSQVIVG